ncbi:hypothetical protein Tco_0526167 [Tanacetum coccineum]
MDDPNITMEEYIRLEEEKAHRRDSENDNDKFNMPSFPSPEPTISCFDDLVFFNNFENEFSAIVYNDALTSKLDFLTEPTVNPQHIDEFDFKDETSLFKCDEEEQNVLYFNDLFSFNVIYLDNLKSDTNNDNDKIDIEQPSGDMSVIPLPSVINKDVGAYAHGSNKLLETKSENMSIRRIGRCGIWRIWDFLESSSFVVICEVQARIRRIHLLDGYGVLM